MARGPIIKFTLSMADGYKVNTLEELKEHFDLKSVMRFFHNGTLLRWLKARPNCKEKAAQVEALSRLDRDLGKKLCAIFGSEGDGDSIPPWIVEAMNRLEQLTDDKNLLKRIEQELIDDKARVAFNQTELEEHVKTFDKIYLASVEFVIPLDMTGKTYIGVGAKATAVIKSSEAIDLDRLNIKLERIHIKGLTTSIKVELAEIERLINSGASRSNYMTRMLTLKKKCIDLKDAESLRKLGDLYKKIPEWLMAEDCYSEADRIDNHPEPTSSDDLKGLLENYKPNTKKAEKKKATDALVQVAENLKKSIDDFKAQGLNEQAGILEARRMMVEDPAMSGAIDEQIDISGSAPQAILDAYESQAQIFEAMDDEYFRGRADDMRKAGELLARHILENNTLPTPPSKKKPTTSPRPRPGNPTLFIGDPNTGKSQFTVEFGWTGKKEGIIFTSEKKVPMLVGTFLLGENDKLTRQEDFIYGGDKHPSGCVQRTFNNDKCIQIKIDLTKIPENITGIAFFLGTENSGQTFSDLSEAYIRLIDKNGIKYTLDYDRDKNIKNAKVVFMATLERQEYEWHFGIIATGYSNMNLGDVFDYFSNEDNDDDLSIDDDEYPDDEYPIDDSPLPPGKPDAKTDTKIQNRKGFHARPASVFVQKASSFKSAIRLAAKGKTVDAKSILMIMSLELTYGTPVTITAWGSDAFEAVTELRKLIESGCGEG